MIRTLDPEYNDGKYYQITSTHHQMQYPFEMDKNHYKILYYADRLSTTYEGSGIDIKKVKYEPEIVLYTVPYKPVCLAIQGHPEMMRKDSPIIEYLNDLVSSTYNKINNEN